jgi:ketosteroid isomerase-like protein
MTVTTTPEIVRRYFALAPSADTEAWFALFDPDAVVEDEGREHRGIDAIRAWRTEVPRVAYAITGVEREGEGLVVTCTITGDFPGSPFAGLHFRFEDFDDEQIRVLRVRP